MTKDESLIELVTKPSHLRRRRPAHARLFPEAGDFGGTNFVDCLLKRHCNCIGFKSTSKQRKERPENR